MYIPNMLKIDGKPCFDRSVWLTSAAEFGRERFQDADNTFSSQVQMLESQRSVHRNERLDGKKQATFEFWHVLQSRAQLKAGTAASEDATPLMSI